MAAANLVYLLLLAGGGVVLPTSTYGALEPVVRWLPSAALGDGIRLALLEGRLGWAQAGLLAAWAVAGTVLTARTFSWE